MRSAAALVAGAIAWSPLAASSQTSNAEVSASPEDGASASPEEIYQDLYDEKRHQYDSTKAVYVQAYAHKTELDGRWNLTLERLEAARAEGAGARERGNLVALANELWDELSAATRAAVAARDQWCQAGNNLIQFIDLRLGVLDNVQDSIPIDYVNMNAHLSEVEIEMGKRGRELGILPDAGQCGIQELPPFPEIRIRPGDTPEEIKGKEDFLRVARERLEAEKNAIDGELEVLTNQQARERRLAAYRAEQESFGRNDPVEDQVSEGVGRARELPIEVRIENLERLRDEVQERIDELAARLEEFERRLGGDR